MRLPLAILLALPAWAQMPTPVPPQLTAAAQLINDYGNTHRYAAENEKTAPPAPGEQRVVFMGDSITDNWGHHIGQFFPGKPYLNRGISGQVTAQMLLRFYPDVIALKPSGSFPLPGSEDRVSFAG